jgi:TonB family protein
MDKKTQFLRRLPVIIGVICTLIIGVGVYFLQSMFEKPAQAKKQVQQITMIQPPPPPPPPPPPEQKQPEPEPEKIAQPEKQRKEDDEPPPKGDKSANSGNEKGSESGDGTGERDGNPGGNGNATLYYGGLVRNAVLDNLDKLLTEDSKARETSYSVQISIWVTPEGQIKEARLNGSSGDGEVDNEIREALKKLQITLKENPREDMPQPLKILLTSEL